MKFAKELEDQAVPEWKTKYLEYKKGKKRLKAVEKAIREFDSKSPPTVTRRPDLHSPFNSLRDAPVKTLLRESPPAANGRSTSSSNAPLTQTRSRSEAPTPRWERAAAEDRAEDATPRARPDQINERSPLYSPETQNGPRMTRYGSIIGSPPHESDSGLDLHPASTLELPMPSIDPEYDRPVSPNGTAGEEILAPAAENTRPFHLSQQTSEVNLPARWQQPPGASQAGLQPTSTLHSRYRGLLHRSMHRSASTPGTQPLRRLFSFAGRPSPSQRQASSSQEIQMQEFEEWKVVESCKRDFHLFLEAELNKIDTFYRERESEAEERLKLLRGQLHTMREWRMVDLQRREHSKNKSNHRHLSAVTAVGQDKVGESSKFMLKHGTPFMGAQDPAAERGSVARQDYDRKFVPPPIKYQEAKRRLKLAMQEIYRSLELLKSYSTLNQKAFRKITKKYNKAMMRLEDRPTDFMSEKVNKAQFVTSDTVDELLRTLEDLYARYFEKGNRKVAVGKLRAKIAKASDYGGPMFRTGALLFTGLIFGIQGLVYAARQYYDSPDGTFKTTTSYLLQIYAGYFCFLALSFLFVVDAMVFENFHVNYPFIFELDSRNNINWRQMSEVPSAFACILGVCMWLNFLEIGGPVMFIYWPVVLIGVSVILLFAPIPGFFYSSARHWFSTTLWRLLLSGLYPVNFRDFFMGDMFCSQTYAMGNLELYFCLYANTGGDHWRNPGQCNSGSSHLLGFLSTLPGIWRALQCARRYYETKNLYPHIANFGKYTCTIAQYMTLSMWRLNKQSNSYKAAFITMASVNSTYCIYWDIVNDWSLSPLQLRPTLVYRKQKWIYYAAIAEDAVLRFLWLGYVIFPDYLQLQHSSLISFMIALLEVCRRGIWVIFRVENEHCTNMIRHRATKRIEMPYPESTDGQVDGAGEVPPAAEEESPVARALKRVGSTVLAAHSQDYERRQPTTIEEVGSDEDDDEDESDGDE